MFSIQEQCSKLYVLGVFQNKTYLLLIWIQNFINYRKKKVLKLGIKLWTELLNYNKKLTSCSSLILRM